MSTKAGTRKKPSKPSPNPSESSIVPNPSGQVLVVQGETNSPNLAQTICEEIAEGKSLRQITKELGISGGTFLRWCEESPELAEHYARARAIGLDLRMEGVRDKAVALQDLIDKDAPPQLVAAARLAWDAERWHASKMYPKKYGDRLEVDQTINAGPSIVEILRGRIEAKRQVEENNELS